MIETIYDLKFHKERLFRETEGVHFSAIDVPGSNGIDLVHHKKQAVSPPNTLWGDRQYYVHRHQTDWNRVIAGSRVFELINPMWNIPRYFVMLRPETGAVCIPPGTLHRSVSCEEGSILLNHAVRDELYDETKEFHPVKAYEYMMRMKPTCIGATDSEIAAFLAKNEGAAV